MFLVTNILQIVSTILTYQLLQLHYVVVGKVLANSHPTPQRWFKLVVKFKFLPSCKYLQMLPSCIADFHVENFKLEQMYKLGTCLCSLKCVSKSHKLPLPTQNLFTKFSLFLLQHSHIHYTLFSADSHMGLGLTLTNLSHMFCPKSSSCQLYRQLNKRRLLWECGSVGKLWECGKIQITRSCGRFYFRSLPYASFFGGTIKEPHHQRKKKKKEKKSPPIIISCLY